ncbi:MAG: hypothetical protein ACE363_14490 [Alphaproteobacteria bacterium]
MLGVTFGYAQGVFSQYVEKNTLQPLNIVLGKVLAANLNMMRADGGSHARTLKKTLFGQQVAKLFLSNFSPKKGNIAVLLESWLMRRAGVHSAGLDVLQRLCHSPRAHSGACNQCPF